VRCSVALALCASAVLAAGAARADDATEGHAEHALRGFRYVLKPALAYDYAAGPLSGQDVTFAISDHIGWAIPLGPLVVSPGASLPIYFFSNNVTLAILAEAELHLPLRWVSPYVVVGGGGAFFFGGSNDTVGNGTPKPNQQGGVFRAGGGLTAWPLRWLGVGGQIAYLRMASLDIVEVSWPIELRF